MWFQRVLARKALHTRFFASRSVSRINAVTCTPLFCRWEPKTLQVPLRYGVELSPRGVYKVDWVIFDISIEIDPAFETDWVFAYESPRVLVRVSSAVEVEIGFGVKFTCRVAEWVCQRASRVCQLPEGIKGIGLR